MKPLILTLLLCFSVTAQTRISISKESAVSALEGHPLVLPDRGLDLWLKDSTAASLGHLSTEQKHELIDQLVWSLGLPARCWVNEEPRVCVLENWPSGKPKGLK